MTDTSVVEKAGAERGLISKALLDRMLRLEHAKARKARAEDWPAILDIINETVHDSRRSLTASPVTEASAGGTIERFQRHRWPLLVLEVEGEIVAYSSARSLRWGDAATRQMAEVAIYLKQEWYGTGAALLAGLHLYAEARSKGFELATSWIAGGNTASIAVAKAFGLTLWGILPNAICHGGTRSDLHIYGASLFDSSWLEHLAIMKAKSDERIARLKARAARYGGAGTSPVAQA
ncbi:GNAT family N-acetyltransferase [Trinickia fusca]|uniref:GNAT family N-acetyltransferase n=1 Tax=Trinickia fusca TaxID=2419777 RepID=A0A494X8U9_9BURK|nr:GNAT family N-acetyltransferase [Trinickia fusca]RKP46890.1 GNAT family N-acetyltransferase [Trinickia fusca]